MRCSTVHSHRAMTLVEVLAATVLLAMVAGTCASLLRSVAQHANDGDLVLRTDELAELADRWLRDRAVESAPPALDWPQFRGSELDCAWPTNPARDHIRVRLVQCKEGDVRCWIELESGGARVWRWCPADRDDPGSTP